MAYLVTARFGMQPVISQCETHVRQSAIVVSSDPGAGFTTPKRQARANPGLGRLEREPDLQLHGPHRLRPVHRAEPGVSGLQSGRIE